MECRFWATSEAAPTRHVLTQARLWEYAESWNPFLSKDDGGHGAVYVQAV